MVCGVEVDETMNHEHTISHNGKTVSGNKPFLQTQIPMPAIITGIALLALGPIFYLLGEAGHRSFTSFIPSAFGLIILLCGLAALKPTLTKTAMHAAVLFGIIGVIGSLRGLSKWPGLLDGSLVDGRLAAISTLLMFVICLMFIFASISQFVAMRRV